ncbi:hypothetical protein WJX84_011392 [Apatococcus fuscideae]|uniref:Serine/threonine-protein phosphatase 2A activator n=1 Tax=Apatococcus fuscideae TaxID=2026836 RepID=A0AAW1TAR4_9CHLO
MTVDGDPAPGLGPEVGTRPWRPLWSSVSRSPQPQLGSENFSVHSARSGRNDLAVDMEPIKASWTSGPTQQPSKQSPGTTSRSSTHFVTSRAAFPKQQQLNPGYEKMGSPEKLIKSQADLASDNLPALWQPCLPRLACSPGVPGKAANLLEQNVLVHNHTGQSGSTSAVELGGYLTESFGNRTRIDYGTGHETTFAALLMCLAKLGIFCEADCQALVTRVFMAYLQLMRRLQTTYWLEPAGSHGVWGLDDYQFLPFVFGSNQLVAHPDIRPASIHVPEVLSMSAQADYLYLGCIGFVLQVKKGPLAETSPMLNDISGVATWSKVNQGMVKMYQAEVLSKLPIMQHFLFGTFIHYKN